MRVEIVGIEATIVVLNKYASTTGRRALMPRTMEIIAEEFAEAARTTTHVITGALRGSHTAMKITPMKWEVTPNPGTINPFGFRPAEYGPVEHARGGDHAFYERAIRERLVDVIRDAVMRVSAEFG